MAVKTQVTLHATSTGHLPRHVYFCAWMVAGWRTQYANARKVANAIPGVSMHYVEIDPYKDGGLIERLPLMNHRTKGSLRAFISTLSLFRAGPIDGLWTHANTAIFPFLFTRARVMRIPYIISADATLSQIEAFEEYHLTQPGRNRSLKYWLRDRIEGYSFRHAAYVVPCSHWAAQAIAAQFGVPEERIVVVPPGIDLTQWQLRPSQPADQGETRSKLLFVGGNFERKGGRLLLDVFRKHFRERCELHIVTKESVAEEPGVFVYHDLGPNDPDLHRLYQACDVFVLPTTADCFSLASLEAMASGLPVITCPVGGIPEIVEDGRSGYLVPERGDEALRVAVEEMIADPLRARAMGLRGRAIVEERFDAAKNVKYALGLLQEVRIDHRRFTAARRQAPAKVTR